MSLNPANVTIRTENVFRWSIPADEGVKPWRIASSDKMRDALAELGLDGRHAYVDHETREPVPTLWVGLRDNRNPMGHAARLVELARVLCELGFAAETVQGETRVVGIHVRDHHVGPARLG